jgi:ribosome assembly protein 1
MIEGTNIIIVKALLPIANSFGFASDVRSQTGGDANPVLVFDHWEIVNKDPFWVPTTEDELEEFGTTVSKEQVEPPATHLGPLLSIYTHMCLLSYVCY